MLPLQSFSLASLTVARLVVAGMTKLLFSVAIGQGEPVARPSRWGRPVALGSFLIAFDVLNFALAVIVDRPFIDRGRGCRVDRSFAGWRDHRAVDRHELAG